MELIVTYIGEKEPNVSFMDTWLDSPYIYDIYNTRFYDSYDTSQIWRLKYWHIDMPILNRAS